MRRNLLKIVTVVLLLALLTMPNFIYVGMGLASYAVSSTATSHQNVEFGAEIKEGNILSLIINIKKEGYFNGEITLENSNFTFDKETNNSYINKIEDTKIVLNQINAGTTAQIDLKIKPIESEYFDIGLLSSVSKLNISGDYKDSSEKDIKITGTREVEYHYTEDNTNESVENTARVITNKILKVSGEDKRVVQMEMNLGLKDNNYPIKEIELNIDVPVFKGERPNIIEEGEYPKIVIKTDFNNMTHFDSNYVYNYEKSRLNILFTNNPNEENKVKWIKQGNEKIVLTFIYNKNINIENAQFIQPLSETCKPITKVTLYNEKELNSLSDISFSDFIEEKEELVSVSTTNMEDTIYKGKLYAGVDRQYESKTNIAINSANAEQYLDVKESSDYSVFNKTIIEKNSLKEIFGEGDELGILGENGQITIYNEKSEIIAIVNKNTETDELGNIVINYAGNEPKVLEIKTTIPVKEGNIELINTKTIKAENSEVFKGLTELNTKITYDYLGNEVKESTSTIKLEETKTEAELLINKDTLSTVVENNVEMKAVLKGNNEQYNLFKNPVITFELPEDVESVSLSREPQIVYDTELKIKNSEIDNDRKTVTVYLEGEQTQYKNESIEGTVILVNANILVNKKASSKDTKINMNIANLEQQVNEQKDIRIVASKDITAINSIKELNIETIGQEELKTVSLQRGTTIKQLEASLEIINNNENSIENVRIMGNFPTKNKENNIDIKIINGITIDGAEVYYTENEDATEDINNTVNAWSREIIDSAKVKKYLVIIPSIDMQSSAIATFKFEIPELLEYNQHATEAYTVKYINSLTKIENELNSTAIKMETGVGPILEVKLVPAIGGTDINSESTVKNGEVIKYRIEVSNTGSEELRNVNVTANIPEGTTLVKPQDNYEYSGASYYEELPNRTFEATIEKIGPGEIKKGEYEVRVNSDTQPGIVLIGEAQIKYGDVTKKSNQAKLITENGDLRVSVKRVTDRKKELYENDMVKYFAIVENISDSKKDNIEIETKLPSNFSVARTALITGNDENAQTEEIEYSNSMNIGSIESGESKILYYGLDINNNSISNDKFSVLAKNNNSQYRSNTIKENINKVDVSVTMSSNTQSQYVKAGDILEYTITINNNTDNRIKGLILKDSISKSLTVKKVTFDDEEISKLEGINDIEISCEIAAKSYAEIKITTVVNYAMSRVSAEAITNVAYVEMSGERLATTQEISHIIEANPQEEPTGGDNPTGGDIADGKQMITGVAWFDENANGKKDEGEKTLNNVKVHLLNTETNSLVKDSNGKVIEATTNDKGIYILSYLRNGEYIVIFEYDKNLYTLTKYKAENIQESENSNAINNELLIENEKQTVASTDIIQIKDNNISNINIGLVQLKDFAFRLDKYVSKILVQNSSGTTVKEYTNATVAKAELDAKKVNGTNVIIEYEIKVTNIGELDGYVRKIIDYMPNDLKFSSELNKDWYQTGDGLYNASLANEKIPAGQSRVVKLTLTKAMTENNTGLINNTAEIAESYNELGIKDSKSTAGNKAQGESDYGSADAILSLKTGEDTYIAIAAVVIAVLGVIVFVIIIKKHDIGDIK